MFIAEKWIDSVVNVVRVNERIMYVKLVIGKQIVNIVSAYAPQVGLSAEEKDDFWDSFIIVLSGIPKRESIFIGGDMNGHVGRDADGYGGVYTPYISSPSPHHLFSSHVHTISVYHF